MRALVIGAGAVGARAVRQLVESPDVDEVDGRRHRPVARRPPSSPARAPRRGPAPHDDAADAVLLAGPCGTHAALARAPRRGRPARGVHQRLDRRRAGAARPRRRGPSARERRGRRRRGVLARLLVRAGAPRGHQLHHGHRGARGPQRHRRPGLRPPAPRRAHRPGPRLARRRAGSAGRPARAGSCAGSPIRSAPRTATAPSCPTRCCSCRPSPASSASRPACPPPGATASPPTSRCCASRTRRGWSAPPGSRCGACATGRPTCWCSARSTVRPSRRGPPPPWRCGGRSPAGCPSGPGAWARVDDPVAFLAELVTVGIKAAVFEGSG